MTRSILVIDASAAVEYLLRTPLGLVVGDIVADADLAAPELMDAEVIAVLRRAVLHEHLPEDRALATLDDLATWRVQRISHRGLTRSAWRHRHNLPAYDALYVALAQANDATLLTADRRLARAPGLGVAVVDVGAEME